MIEAQVAYDDLHVLENGSVELFWCGLVFEEESDDLGNFAQEVLDLPITRDEPSDEERLVLLWFCQELLLLLQRFLETENKCSDSA